MILVLIFLGVLAIISLIIFILMLSTLRLEVKNLELSNTNGTTDQNYEAKISINLFNKIKIASIKFNNERIRKIYTKVKLNKIDIQKIKQNFNIKDTKIIKNLKPELIYLNLKLDLGLEDVILTSSLVFVISTAISILLPHIVKKYSKENYEYIIEPLYINKNVYYIKLNCIIQLKIVHIINIIYIYCYKAQP